MWAELAEDADVSGGLRSEDGGLPARPPVIEEYGRFAYLEGRGTSSCWQATANRGFCRILLEASNREED